MGTGSGSIKSIVVNDISEVGNFISEKSKKQVREIQKKIKEQKEIDEFRRQMNFPEVVERTSYSYRVNSNQSSYEDENTSNKSSSYNRTSKRGTRLVRSV